MEEVNTGEQANIRDKRIANLQPYMYKKGQSGNPSGRPKGISMKEYLKLKFASMSEDERETFLEGVNKLDLLKMAEGNPDTKSDVTTNGKDLPQPIINVFPNDSNSQDNTTQA